MDTTLLIIIVLLIILIYFTSFIPRRDNNRKVYVKNNSPIHSRFFSQRPIHGHRHRFH